MTKSKLRGALVGIIISHMVEYDNMKLNATLVEDLYKDLKHDVEHMYSAWWRTSFPYFHFTVTVQIRTSDEPRLIFNWCPNTNNTEYEWDRLTFHFNPARLIGDIDPIKAYDRAMAII